MHSYIYTYIYTHTQAHTPLKKFATWVSNCSTRVVASEISMSWTGSQWGCLMCYYPKKEKTQECSHSMILCALCLVALEIHKSIKECTSWNKPRLWKGNVYIGASSKCLELEAHDTKSTTKVIHSLLASWAWLIPYWWPPGLLYSYAQLMLGWEFVFVFWQTFVFNKLNSVLHLGSSY